MVMRDSATNSGTSAGIEDDSEAVGDSILPRRSHILSECVKYLSMDYVSPENIGEFLLDDDVRASVGKTSAKLDELLCCHCCNLACWPSHQLSELQPKRELT